MYRFLILAAALLGIISCNTEELERLRSENLTLKNEQGRSEEALFNFAETMNSIQTNLDSISMKEGMISKIATGENSDKTGDQVNTQINAIYDMLIQNRKQLEKISRQAQTSSKQNKDLQAIIDRMTKQMEEKVVEIEMLRSQLENMQYQITGLNSKIDSLQVTSEYQKETIADQSDEIASKTEQLNTVFYTMGTEKELIENEVLSKGGIFKSNSILPDMNKKYFDAADKYEKRTFVIGYKKLKITTPHPETSYKLYGENPVDSLVVTDPDLFWSNSKYLIISVRK